MLMNGIKFYTYIQGIHNNIKILCTHVKNIRCDMFLCNQKSEMNYSSTKTGQKELIS